MFPVLYSRPLLSLLRLCPLLSFLTGKLSPQAASKALTVICIPVTHKSVCPAPRSDLSFRSMGPSAFLTHLKFNMSKDQFSFSLNLL